VAEFLNIELRYKVMVVLLKERERRKISQRLRKCKERSYSERGERDIEKGRRV
jgi:hypothetical protein